MSKVPAHWEYMSRIVKIRDEMSLKTKIIGNGDVRDLTHAKELAEVSGCDGVMIGRAIFGNPWLFSYQGEGYKENIFKKFFSLFKKKDKYWLKTKLNVGVEEKLKVLIENTKLFEELLGSKKNFAIMKKHYKAYVNGFPGSKDLRMKLMDAKDSKEIEAIIQDFLNLV
jgi:tRNA-dihydrouridine synthase